MYKKTNTCLENMFENKFNFVQKQLKKTVI